MELSGPITASEVLNAASIMNQDIRNADTDDNGTISEEEFVNFAKMDPAEAKKLFHERDTDNSGTLRETLSN